MIEVRIFGASEKYSKVSSSPSSQSGGFCFVCSPSSNAGDCFCGLLLVGAGKQTSALGEAGNSLSASVQNCSEVLAVSGIFKSKERSCHAFSLFACPQPQAPWGSAGGSLHSALSLY